MVFGHFNNMNMLGMNGMFGMNGSFSTGNLVSQLFSGTNSVFNTGCFGGGTSFFGGFPNMFGGGCSLFTNCNGTINYDAMAGFGVANVLLGIGGQIANQAIEDKKANSKETIQADIQTLDKQIQEQVDKLGCDSAEEALKFPVEEKYQKEIETVETSIKEKETSLESHKKTISALEKELATAPDADKSEIQTKLDAAKKEKEKVEKEIKTLKETTLVEKREAKEAREKEIKEIQAEIRRLQAAKANAQEILDDKQLNTADGNQFQRTSLEDLKAKFNENGELNDGQTVSKADVRAAIKGYRTATNDKEKAEWKDKFQKLWANFDYEDRTSDLRSAYNIICG